jgi:PAS domain S-box-containing protein
VIAARQQKHVEEKAFDGHKTHWVETFKNPIIDGHGEVLGTVGFARDISERKTAEAALLQSEANMRAMLDNLPYLTWLKDSEGHYISINKIFADFLHIEDPRQVIGKTDLDLQPKELAEKYRADDAAVMAARQHKRVEESAFDGNNTRWVETFKTPIIDVHGKVLGTAGFARDITERKQAEEEIRLENETGRKRAKELAQQFGRLLQSSFNEIYLFDAHTLRFLQTSEGAQINLGYSADELEQLTPLNLKPLYTQDSFEELIAPLRSGEQQSLLFDTTHRRKDGTTYTVEVRLQLMESESPVFLAIVQDITEREKAEQNKRKLTRALQLLSECGTLLIHAKNEQRLLEDICQLAVVTGGYLMAWVGFAEKDAAKSIRPVAQSGYEDEYLDNVKLTWSDTEYGQGPSGTAIRTGASVINLNCLTNPKMAPWREAAIKRGYQSSIALPLASNKHLFGALTIYSVEPQAFSNEEVALLEELANNLAFGIETLRTRGAHQRAEQESRELSAHLQTVREEEKASFAREIHDDLGGTLTALKMDAYWLANKLAPEKEMASLHKCALSMVGQLNSAVLATRRIITDLRPSLLDDLGLLEALRWQCAEFHKRTGIECRVVCTGKEGCEDEMDGTQAINLFRITQESLTNVVRHSGATKVGVHLHRDNEEVVLSISDNGRGLPEGHTIASTSYGLRGMRERVVQLGGKIKFDKPAGGGFTVMVRLPVAAAPE